MSTLTAYEVEAAIADGVKKACVLGLTKPLDVAWVIRQELACWGLRVVATKTKGGGK